jgi:hypothetical protein
MLVVAKRENDIYWDKDRKKEINVQLCPNVICPMVSE